MFCVSRLRLFFLFKTAAAGFEEAKAKLGLVQSRSTELEKEAAALKKKASCGL